MIKNQLYPFIEKYFNEYLWGFTKEQFNIGVMNGTILLEKINLRSDKINEKLDSLDLPIWLKAGAIKLIKIACSLMNFIGEKPLDIMIENVDCILTCSYKWILKNLNTFIEEGENHIRDPYDPTDNNSHEVFAKKINIYDGSILKEKQNLFEIFTDKTKLTEFINKIFTKALKFYYQKPYLINIKIKNVSIRFEDDEFNFNGKIALGLKMESFEGSLSTDGIMKKNSFKAERINIYWEPNPNILIPSSNYLELYDIKTNTINEKYYNYLQGINLDTIHKNHIWILNNFNFVGNFGTQVIESGNVDFFSNNREKNIKFYIQIATSDINLNIYPEFTKYLQSLLEILRCHYLVENIQDYKPMRKPYNRNSDLIKKYDKDSILSEKRKLVTRDWLYYLIWHNRFKKAVYGNIHKNPLNEEFSKYFNICILANDEENPNESYNSINIKKPEEKKKVDNEDLNPEKINLVIYGEVLVKGINLILYSNNEKTDFINIKLSNLSNKFFIGKDKFDLILEVKEFSLNSKNHITISRSMLDTENITKSVSDNKEMNFSFDSASHTSNGIINNKAINHSVVKKLNILNSTIDKITNSQKLPINKQTIIDNQNQSLLNVFFIDEKIEYKEVKKMNISSAINDHNKKLIQVPPQAIVKNEKVSLNILEILPTTHNGIQIKIVKSSVNLKSKDKPNELTKKVSESFTINLGAIRMHLNEEEINKCLSLISEYLQIKKIKKIKNDLIKSNFVNQKIIYEMKKYIINKLSFASANRNMNKNMELFKNYLDKDMNNYDHKLIQDGKFEINYIFNILNKFNIELDFNYNDIIINCYAFDLIKNPIHIGKIKIPKIDYKLIINRDKLILKLFDFNIEYNDLEKWRSILNKSFDMIVNKFNFHYLILEPVVKMLLDDFQNDENKLKRELDQSNTDTAKMVSKINLNSKTTLKDIIENNMTNKHIYLNDTMNKSKDSSNLESEPKRRKSRLAESKFEPKIIFGDDSALIEMDNLEKAEKQVSKNKKNSSSKIPNLNFKLNHLNNKKQKI